MKQKSIFLSLLTATIVAMLSVGLAACDSDDDSSAGGGVIGTWTGVYDPDILTLTFKSGGTGTYILKVYEEDELVLTDKGTFTYTPADDSKGMIFIKFGDSDSYSDSYSSSGSEEVLSYYYVIEGKTMYLYEDAGYEDLELKLTKQ